MVTAPRRRADITRSRGHKKSDAHFSEKNNQDLVEFCRATGLRNHKELQQICGDQLEYRDGYYYIVGVKGKAERSVMFLCFRITRPQWCAAAWLPVPERSGLMYRVTLIYIATGQIMPLPGIRGLRVLLLLSLLSIGMCAAEIVPVWCMTRLPCCRCRGCWATTAFLLLQGITCMIELSTISTHLFDLKLINTVLIDTHVV